MLSSCFRVLIFIEKYFRIDTDRVSYSLDPDQARQNGRSNLGPNCLQRASAYDNSGKSVKDTAKQLSENAVCVYF